MYLPIDILDNIISLVIKNYDYSLLNKLCIVSNSVRSIISNYITDNIINDIEKKISDKYVLLLSFLLDNNFLDNKVENGSLLFSIIREESVGCLKIYLKRYKSTINKKYECTLNETNYTGQIDVLSYFFRNNYLYNIYEYAPIYDKSEEDYDKPEILRLLLENGADPNIKIDFNDEFTTPLQLAIGDPCLINILLEYGANPNISNNDGNTALHQNIYYFRSIQCIRILLDYNIDINIKNNFGDNALSIITQRLDPDVNICLGIKGDDSYNETIYRILMSKLLHKIYYMNIFYDIDYYNENNITCNDDYLINKLNLFYDL